MMCNHEEVVNNGKPSCSSRNTENKYHSILIYFPKFVRITFCNVKPSS